jgi:hypothetical protein
MIDVQPYDVGGATLDHSDDDRENSDSERDR